MENQKLLLIKLSSLGDVIFNMPLANVLKAGGYEVHWLTSEKGYPVLKNNPCVNKVILAPVEKWKKEKNIFKNIAEFINIIKTLQNEKYDISIDTQMRLKSLLFMRFCGARRRIISKDAKEFSILGANEIIPKTRDGAHVVKSYLKFAEYLGLNTDNIQQSLPDFSEESKELIDYLNSNLDKSKKTIVIAPATTWEGKHWNKSNWKNLISKLGNCYNLIYTGTPKDLGLINFIKGDFGINLVGKTNLKQLVEVLKLADLVISLDSGTTHLAWGVQHPKILSIYCATPKKLYAPLGDENKYIALEGENCTPCHHKKCPKKTDKYYCTTSPSVELVFEKVCELLN